MLIAGSVVAAIIVSACVVKNTSLTTIGGNDIFAGELQNRTNQQILAHAIQVDFLDPNGNVIDSQTVPGCLRSVQPGTSDFFEVQSTQPAASIASARGKFSINSSLRLGAVQTASVSISGVQVALSGTSLAVSGTVLNTGALALSSPKVCVVLRNSGNAIVRVGSQMLGDLPPNASGPFSVTLTVPSDATASNNVDVWADALQGDVPTAPVSNVNNPIALATPTPSSSPSATPSPSFSANCAFSQTPTTYETTEERTLYLQAMNLAAYNMLFPGDGFFSQPSIGVGTRQNRTSSPSVYVPPTLLKAISWIESNATQGAPGLPFGAIGPALVSFDCGYGIAQVTSGMTAPLGENGQPSDQQALVATHFAYNIGRGAAILIDKWNAAPANRPIAGIDTNSDPHIVENWYFAVWGYNGFTGPGANRSNHPLDPIYGAWPRTPYSCGPANDSFSHNRSLFPYQELVYGCLAHPPIVLGQTLWQPLPATLPDLNNPYWRAPLDLRNFQYPYSQMDIPTPKPLHDDPTALPDPVTRLAVLGQPGLTIDRPMVLINVAAGQASAPVTVNISNTGSGITSWRAAANKPWVRLSQQAGVAVAPDMSCLPGSPCQRVAALTISVDPSQITGNDAAVVRIFGLGLTTTEQDVAVFVRTS